MSNEQALRAGLEALEYIESAHPEVSGKWQRQDAIEAIRAALTAHARPVDEAMVRRAFNAPLHSHNVAWIAFGYHNTPEPGTWQWDAMRAALEAALQPAQATPAAVDALPCPTCKTPCEFTENFIESGERFTRYRPIAAPHAQDTAPVLCVDCGQPTMHMGDVCFGCTKVRKQDTAPRGGGAMWGADDLRRWANACKDKRGGVLIPDAVSGDVYDVLTWAADNLTAPPAAQASEGADSALINAVVAAARNLVNNESAWAFSDLTRAVHEYARATEESGR